MTEDKLAIATIAKWLRHGISVDNDNHVYYMTSSDHCRAIENIKKSGDGLLHLSSNSKNICNRVITLCLEKDMIIDALYDEDFCRSQVSQNQNGLSISSYISIYYQKWYQYDKEEFTKDIVF